MKEIKFLSALWKINLASAMEYRVAFISQSIGMILNDGVYFLIWIIFFDRFKDIRGWQLTDMFLVFGVVWIITCHYHAPPYFTFWPAGPSRVASEISSTVLSVILHPDISVWSD